MCAAPSSRQASVRGRRRRGGDAAMRVSDAERERVVERLRVAAGEGRLELDELEQRIEAAYLARTRAELRAPVGDLPEPRGRRRGALRRTVAVTSTATLLVPLVVGIAVISLMPPLIAWTGWLILAWWCFACLPAAGIGFAWCGFSRRRVRRGTRLAA